jgi:hypothetical protein
MTAWTDLVKKIWEENKKTPGFKFKDALIKAKSQYKSGPLNKSVKKMKTKIMGRKRGGNQLITRGGEDSATAAASEEGDEKEKEDSSKDAEEGGDEKEEEPSPVMGGKSKRRTKKNKKDDKKKGGDKVIGATEKGTPYFAEGK